MQLDFTSVPASLQCSVMTENLMNDSQYVGCTLAVIGSWITARASMTVDIVSILALCKSYIKIYMYSPR